MKQSDQAWKHCSKIIDLIHQHPFNQELSNAQLDKRKFSYYIEQDSLYS